MNTNICTTDQRNADGDRVTLTSDSVASVRDPLVIVGQGEYRREISPEDLAAKIKMEGKEIENDIIVLVAITAAGYFCFGLFVGFLCFGART